MDGHRRTYFTTQPTVDRSFEKGVSRKRVRRLRANQSGPFCAHFTLDFPRFSLEKGKLSTEHVWCRLLVRCCLRREKSSGLLTSSAANVEHIRELKLYLDGFAQQHNCANVTDLFEKLRGHFFRVGFLHGSGIKGPEAEHIAAQDRYRCLMNPLMNPVLSIMLP